MLPLARTAFPMTAIYYLFSLFVCCVPLVCEMPEWFVTTWIGAAWGVLFLSGLAASWVSHRASWLVHCAFNATAVQASIEGLTDFGPNACWLLTVLLLGSGWLMGVALIPWEQGRRVPGRIDYAGGKSGSHFQCSIWDLLCATTLIGLLCWLVPKAEMQFDMLCQIAPAYVAGVIMSIVAVPLAWRTEWTNSQWLSLWACTAITLFLIGWWVFSAPLPVTWSWLLRGPLVVVAAQFFIVLLGLGIHAWRQHINLAIDDGKTVNCSSGVQQLSLVGGRLHLFDGDL